MKFSGVQTQLNRVKASGGRLRFSKEVYEQAKVKSGRKYAKAHLIEIVLKKECVCVDLNKIKYEWFGNIKGDVLAGVVVALALIPEAIAFSIIAGVDPMIGLYASFCIAVTIAFVGGRPGMISAATGATALVMVTLVAEHGLQYLLAATVLTGILQIIMGALKLGNLIKFVPRSVMTGFVNALAIMIFTAQLTHFVGESWQMYAMVAGALMIIYILPRMTKAVPSSLVAIIAITIIAVMTGSGVRTVGDMGELTQALPIFLIPDIPFTFETLQIIFPYSLSIAIVGLVESLLTAQIVDDMTDTGSDKNKEAKARNREYCVWFLWRDGWLCDDRTIRY